MEHAELVAIAAGSVVMEGMLEAPPGAHGTVLFAHGSGSSRRSPRNNAVAARLRADGLGTLLLDLLSPEEDRHPARRFDIELLSDRLGLAASWLKREPSLLPLGLFGATQAAWVKRRMASLCAELGTPLGGAGPPWTIASAD